MAVRIRKLARELDRSPADLIGVLHALGFQRFRSPEDMVPSPIEAKLRKGIGQGVAPIAVDVVEAPAPRRPDGIEALADGGVDLMAQLVPGAIRAGAKARPVAKAAPVPRSAALPPPAPAPAVFVEPSPAPTSSRGVELERAALESLRRTLESERAVLDASRAELEVERRRVSARERALDGDREALDGLRAALEVEREQLRAERTALDGLRAKAAPGGAPLQDLLEARGLRGSDEQERAVAALARGRHLRDVLWALHVDAPEPFARLLDERLLLVAGELPESVTRGAATVAVAPDRADLPDAATLDRWLAQLGERLLLHGHRRVLVAGGKAWWQRLLRERLDPRIEARFAPGGRRTRAMATEDVGWADVVILWGVSPDQDARAIYEAARPVVVDVEDDGLFTFFDAVQVALAL